MNQRASSGLTQPLPFPLPGGHTQEPPAQLGVRLPRFKPYLHGGTSGNSLSGSGFFP